MEFDKAGFETVYSFQLDWPEGADTMYVWAEGVSGDQVVGTSRQVVLAREGQGGSVSEQTGVGSGSNTSNSDSGSASSDTSDGESADDSNGSRIRISGGGGFALVVGALTSAFLL